MRQRFDILKGLDGAGLGKIAEDVQKYIKLSDDPGTS